MKEKYSVKIHPLPPVYDYFCEVWVNGGAYRRESPVAQAQDNRIRIRQPETQGEGFCDCYGNVIVPPIYDCAREYASGISVVGINVLYDEGEHIYGTYGGVDYDGNVVIPLIYEWLCDMQEGYAVAQLDGKWGIIDKTGRIAAPFIYDDVFGVGGSPPLVVLGEKYGVLSIDGKELVPCTYDNWEDALRAAPVKGDFDDAEFDSGEYDRFPYEIFKLGPFRFGRIDREKPYMEPGYYKAITADRDADVVSPEEYQKMQVDHEILSGESSYKIGLMDDDDNIVLPPDYVDVRYAYGKGPKGFTAKSDGRWYFIELVCGE